MRASRSFDLFDTLIARYHCFPNSIFEIVEEKFPFPGFVFYRTLSACKSDHTFANIYKQLQQMLDISKSAAKKLRDFEFAIELNQIYPITENLNLVQDGSLIVTDTYYSKAQIRSILKKIGLKKKVCIYAHPFGKSSGVIWDVIKNKHLITCHLGDSLHSDVTMPQSRGLIAHHDKKSKLTPIENAMMELGQVSLGCLMRSLRLQNPYPPDSPEYLLWNDQCQLNIPVLIQASIYLNDFCQKEKKKRVLFTARDGCLWIRIFQKLYPQYESIYFHSSRFTYEYPTPTYIEYVRQIYTNESIIVDSNGRGTTCARFFEKHLEVSPTYLAIVSFSKEHRAILRKVEPNDGIEKMNYDVVGALSDVQEGKPIRIQPEYDLRYVYPSHACVEKCIEILSHFNIDFFELQIVELAVNAMKSGLAIEKYIDHEMFHSPILIDELLRNFDTLKTRLFL